MVEKVSAKGGIRVGINMEAGKGRAGKVVGPLCPTIVGMCIYCFDFALLTGRPVETFSVAMQDHPVIGKRNRPHPHRATKMRLSTRRHN